MQVQSPEYAVVERLRRSLGRARSTRDALREIAYVAGRWVGAGVAEWIWDEVRSWAGDDQRLLAHMEQRYAAGQNAPYARHDVAALLRDDQDDVPQDAIVVQASAEANVDAAVEWVRTRRAPVVAVGGMRWTQPTLSDPITSPSAARGAIERITWVTPDGRVRSCPQIHAAVYDALVASAPRVRIGGVAVVDGQWVDGVGLHGAYYCVDDTRADDIGSADPVAEIWRLFKDFPLRDDDARARVLAALLTPLLLHMIDGPIPALLVSAHAPGAGKTLLARLISIIADGRDCVAVWPTDQAEVDEVVISVLETPARVVVLDNLRGRLQSAVIEAALTSRRIYGRRKYGRSEERPVDALLIVTGNDPQITRDVARRVVRLQVDRGGAEPPDGLPDVARMAASRRSWYLGCLRALWRRWVDAGSPRVRLRGAASYEAWSEVIGGILMTAGEIDRDWRPIDVDAVSQDCDPDTVDVLRLVDAWAAAEAARGSIGAWRDADTVARLAATAVPRRRGRPDLIVGGLLMRAARMVTCGGHRVAESDDGRLWRVDGTRQQHDHDDDTPY